MRPFTLVKQHDAMQCGAACLSMVCRYYGKSYPLKWLDSTCFPTREGVSMLAMSKAAKAIGLDTACYKLTIDRLRDIKRPCILYWNQNHFVVLYKVGRTKFYVADPGKGLIVYNVEEFSSHWLAGSYAQDNVTGIVMELTPSRLFGTIEPPYTEGQGSMGFLFRYINRHRRYFGHILMCLLVGSVLQLIMPFLTQSIVDIGIKNSDIGFIWSYICTLVNNSIIYNFE